ncbi:hypothetical protein MYX84_04045 [Acidobacteria bacterium AH-259-O06]|nr:hypothetical protein [Acidobacteria bacterium AH-259-O06]
MALTPNEKEMLAVFKEVKKTNAWAMGKKLLYSTEYAEDLLKGLCAKGYLGKQAGGKYPIYSLTGKGKQEIAGRRTL